MRQNIVLIAGPPGGGKTTIVNQYPSHIRMNRDDHGGTIKMLHQATIPILDSGESIVLDNTYPTIESRASIIAIAQARGIPIHMKWLMTTAEQAQFFSARRQIQRYGKLFRKQDYKDHKGDPNIFPPAAQFAYWKRVEKATEAEGFTTVEDIPVTVDLGSEYKNKALILDYDGTLRETISGDIYPKDPSDVKALPNCERVLKDYVSKGYLLLGASNQSGCSKKPGHERYVSQPTATACFLETNKQLNADIKFLFAADAAGAPSTHFRKPQPGMGVYFIEKYKLDPAQCIMVGDMKVDQTFAARCGFQFQWAKDFFGWE